MIPVLPAKFYPFLYRVDGACYELGVLYPRACCAAMLGFISCTLRTSWDTWFKTTFYAMLCNALVSKAPQGHLNSPLGGSMSRRVPASLGRFRVPALRGRGVLDRVLLPSSGLRLERRVAVSTLLHTQHMGAQEGQGGMRS